MSHEEYWSWLYIIGTAGLGWTPNTVMNAHMSDILLAWEGKAMLMKEQYGREPPPKLTADTFRAMFKGKNPDAGR